MVLGLDAARIAGAFLMTPSAMSQRLVRAKRRIADGGAAFAQGVPCRYQWEAAVQSVHAARRVTGVTDWGAILLFYDALLAETGSPVIAVNRAVALAERVGAAMGRRQG